MADLSSDQRAKLDGIVQQMTQNGESDDYIQGVVNDFKQKYAESTPQSTQKKPYSAADAFMNMLKGAGSGSMGILKMLDPMGNGIDPNQAGDVKKQISDTKDVLTKGSREDVDKFLGSLIPGAVLGSMATPGKAPINAIADSSIPRAIMGGLKGAVQGVGDVPIGLEHMNPVKALLKISEVPGKAAQGARDAYWNVPTAPDYSNVGSLKPRPFQAASEPGKQWTGTSTSSIKPRAGARATTQSNPVADLLNTPAKQPRSTFSPSRVARQTTNAGTTAPPRVPTSSAPAVASDPAKLAAAQALAQALGQQNP